MRIKARGVQLVDIDMTPMIDMTFQLIAFFMILINFTDSEQDERIQLPSSVLAKPPDAHQDTLITIQLTRSGQAIIGGETFADPAGMKAVLNNERYVLESSGRTAKDATIVIRAHRASKTGQVQNVIKVCQEAQFERFTLRAKEDVGNF
jgi:biopolymer transport protein ExbD